MRVRNFHAIYATKPSPELVRFFLWKLFRKVWPFYNWIHMYLWNGAAFWNKGHFKLSNRLKVIWGSTKKLFTTKFDPSNAPTAARASAGRVPSRATWTASTSKRSSSSAGSVTRTSDSPATCPDTWRPNTSTVLQLRYPDRINLHCRTKHLKWHPKCCNPDWFRIRRQFNAIGFVTSEMLNFITQQNFCIHLC